MRSAVLLSSCFIAGRYITQQVAAEQRDAVTRSQIRIPPALPEPGGGRNLRTSLQDLDPIVQILDLRLEGMFARTPFTGTKTVFAIGEEGFDGP